MADGSIQSSASTPHKQQNLVGRFHSIFSKRMLSDGGSLADLPLIDADSEPTVQIPEWTKVGAVFLFSLGFSVALLFLCDRVSTFYAWLIIVFVSGLVCFGTSLWAEDGRLKVVGRWTSSVCGGICIFSIIGFWILLV
jgi:hypothetical protein